MRLRDFSVAALCLSTPLLVACTGVTVLDSKLDGVCLQTTKPVFVYKSHCPAATGKYLLSTRVDDGGNPCISGDSAQLLSSGTDLMIERVMKQGRGSTGDCLRIEVAILQEGVNDKTADLPVCGLLHPKPFWITEGFDQESEIVFDEDVVRLVPCSE